MRYSPKEVAALLSSYRRLSRGFEHGYDADRAAELHVAVGVLRGLGLAGMLRLIDVSALVGRFLLLELEEDVAHEAGVSTKTIQRATARGLVVMADALNGALRDKAGRAMMVPMPPEGKVSLEADAAGRVVAMSFRRQVLVKCLTINDKSSKDYSFSAVQ